MAQGDVESNDWQCLRSEWTLPEDVIYLNHGSFGPSPLAVQRAREEWVRRLERQPMDFYLRRLEAHLDEAADRLAALLRADRQDIIFVDNATVGMNVVAANVELRPGDEVLLTDHEYGAVSRIWRNRCRQAGANVVVQSLPSPIASDDELVDSLFEAARDKTRLIVVSHVTSPTAVIFPLEKICQRARERGIPVCVDGPHAPAMIPVNLQQIDCDFYASSCHKWLSAPFGTGFLYVARRRQQRLKPIVTSWGRSVSGRAFSWKDEFNWSGTRDPSGFLAVPAAIDFLEAIGWETFRRCTHELAREARRRITELTGLEPLTPDDGRWYGSMVALPLPDSPHEKPKHGYGDPLQAALWERYRIEAVVNRCAGRRYLRISCHLYNRQRDIDRLAEALDDLLNQRGL